MGSSQRSPAGLRTIIVAAIGGTFDSADASDALLTLGTDELPDGAEVYVRSLKATYRLDKASTTAFAAGGTIFPAVNGGNWEYVESPGGLSSAAFGGTINLGGPAVVTSLEWTALPTGSGFYEEASTNNSAFRLDTTSGIVLYLGPSATFLIQAIASLNCATPDQQMWLTVTKNGALIGQTTFDPSAGVSVSPASAIHGVSISTGKILTLAEGDTFQAVLRNSNVTPGDMDCTHLNLIVTPA